MEQIRQGDILLQAVDKTPPAGLELKTSVVMAEGELTGHAHRVIADRVVEWEENGQRYIHVPGKNPGSLVHEDHDPIPTPVVAPNTTYRIVPQQEWDLSDQWKPVVD